MPAAMSDLWIKTLQIVQDVIFKGEDGVPAAALG
jgi:hypothetical protein